MNLVEFLLMKLRLCYYLLINNSALGLGLFSFQVFVYPLAERLLGPVLVTRYAGVS